MGGLWGLQRPLLQVCWGTMFWQPHQHSVINFTNAIYYSQIIVFIAKSLTAGSKLYPNPLVTLSTWLRCPWKVTHLLTFLSLSANLATSLTSGWPTIPLKLFQHPLKTSKHSPHCKNFLSTSISFENLTIKFTFYSNSNSFLCVCSYLTILTLTGGLTRTSSQSFPMNSRS